MVWTDRNSPRIWRAVNINGHEDEPIHIADVYTDELIGRIAGEGFNGIWIFGKLRDLMNSDVFPELNRPNAQKRIDNLRTVIARAAKQDVGVYLYFNDPVSIAIDDPFWEKHANLKGVEKWNSYSLCTSIPQVIDFFEGALTSVFSKLEGLSGVFLITACEALTHCWSKSAVKRGQPVPTCPRCLTREPADIILELLRIWNKVRIDRPVPFRLWAWNWEWCYWYEDPQREIIEKLPKGIELLLDIEIGGRKQLFGRDMYVGEYSFSYTGICERYRQSVKLASSKGIPVNAKIQINNTHELCTVPNIPVIQSLHTKLSSLYDLHTSGILGCWTMGSDFTLNTYAFKLFMRDPETFSDQKTFLEALVEEYFGNIDAARVIRAWQLFSEAFSHYPLSVSFTYFGPHNDAPARILSLNYRDVPICTSYQYSPDPGDNPEKCLGASIPDRQSFTIDEVIGTLTTLCKKWEKGLTDYDSVLSNGQNENCTKELSCAKMIALQMRSCLNVFRFHQERLRVLQQNGLQPPCELPADPALISIMKEEICNAERALPLTDSDPRLGFHQDIQGYKYNSALIREKIKRMREEIKP